MGAHSRPVVEQLGPVVGVGGGAEDVHHHEVLDVVVLPTGLVQLVNVIPVITCNEYDILKQPHTEGPADPLHLPDHRDVHLQLRLTAGSQGGG